MEFSVSTLIASPEVLGKELHFGLALQWDLAIWTCSHWPNLWGQSVWGMPCVLQQTCWHPERRWSFIHIYITYAFASDRNETQMGILHWFHKDDASNRKSIVPLVNVNIWKDPPSNFNGKTHDISTGPFSIANCQPLPEGKSPSIHIKNGDFPIKNGDPQFVALIPRLGAWTPTLGRPGAIWNATWRCQPLWAGGRGNTEPGGFLVQKNWGFLDWYAVD